MARVEMIDPNEAHGDVAALFVAVTEMLGRVPNSDRVLAHSPGVARFLAPFNAVLRRQGAGSLLTTKLKEMVVITTSQMNGCAY